MKKLILALTIVATLSAPAKSQTPAAIQCGGFDTNSVVPTPMAVQQRCTFTTGHYGVVFAIALAEVVCSINSTAQLFIGTGPSPITASNFLGQVSGNTLTVNTMISPSSSWPVQVGQTLSGPGFVPVIITGLGTGTGDTGTYTLSGSPFTQANENMYGLTPIPGSATAITPLMNQTACIHGFTITSIAGAFAGQPATQYWLDVAISTTSGGQATWNNNGITIFTY